MPITAPIAATTSEAVSVMARALSDTGLVTDCQKAEGPCEAAFTATAESGISTITLR